MRKITPSLLGLLATTWALAGTAEVAGRTAPIFREHEGNRVIRDDQLKLVSQYPGGRELFDMTADPTEP